MKVLVSGAAGRIAYVFIPRLCSGEVFGKNVTIELNLNDLKNKRENLDNMVLELEDCAYPLLTKVNITEKLEEAFD